MIKTTATAPQRICHRPSQLFLRIIVGKAEFAFALEGVRGIHGTQAMAIPAAPCPPCLAGLLTLSHRRIVVIDPRTRFELGPSLVDGPVSIIVVETNMRLLGVLVDRVCEVTQLPFIDGGIPHNGEPLLLESLTQVATPEEWDELDRAVDLPQRWSARLHTKNTTSATA